MIKCTGIRSSLSVEAHFREPGIEAEMDMRRRNDKKEGQKRKKKKQSSFLSRRPSFWGELRCPISQHVQYGRWAAARNAAN